MADLNVSLALKIIPEFDGSPENLHRFISCCEIVHDSLKSAEIPSFLKILKVKLVGKAYEVVKFEEFKEWKTLKRTLKSQFTSKRSLESIQLEINSIKQKPSEDVKTFSNRIEHLLYQLNEACLSDLNIDSIKDIKVLNSRMALRSFQEGLLGPTKLLVKACRFNTLKDAITKALEEEAIQKYSTPLNPCIPSSSKSFSAHSKSFGSQFTNFSKCQLCHKTGHTASTCFKLNSVENSKPNLSFNSTNFSSSTHNSQKLSNNSVCAYCHNRGHHIQNCMKRQFNEKKKLNEQSSIATSSTNVGNLKGSEQLGTPQRIRDYK